MKAVRPHRTAKEVENIDSKENLIRLISQYQNLVFSICLKLTGDYFAAEDLTQETFLAAYRHLEEFDGQAEKAWLCRIASNKCIDYRREAARRIVPVSEEEMPETDNTSVEAQQNEPLQHVLNQELIAELEQNCHALPPPYGEVALEHFVKGKTAKEIAEVSGTGLKTAQTRIYRARELLRKSYRKEMLEP